MTEETPKHTHWLYGRGPNKEIDFELHVSEETDCSKCIHDEVCDHNMQKRCGNFLFGSSEDMHGCQPCNHRFTRFDKEPVPCFTCKWFVEKE